MITDEQDIKEAFLSECKFYQGMELPANWSEQLWSYRPRKKEPEIFRGKVDLSANPYISPEDMRYIEQQRLMTNQAIEETKKSYKEYQGYPENKYPPIGYMTS